MYNDLLQFLYFNVTRKTVYNEWVLEVRGKTCLWLVPTSANAS